MGMNISDLLQRTLFSLFTLHLLLFLELHNCQLLLQLIYKRKKNTPSRMSLLSPSHSKTSSLHIQTAFPSSFQRELNLRLHSFTGRRTHTGLSSQVSGLQVQVLNLNILIFQGEIPSAAYCRHYQMTSI